MMAFLDKTLKCIKDLPVSVGSNLFNSCLLARQELL